MKKIYFIFLCCFCSLHLNATNLYLILVSATDDLNIGRGAKQNHLHLKKQFLEIEKTTNLELQLLELEEAITSTKISNLIKSLKTTPDDVIIFYYSGHGINSGKNRWPQFLIPGEEILTLDEVFLQLKSKPHRLLMTIGDCCNIGEKLNKDPEQLMAKGKAMIKADNCIQLFETSSGDFIASGCGPGQTSAYFKNIGGIYTSSWLDALRSTVKAKDTTKISWPLVFATAAELTQELASIAGEVQNPQFIQENMISKTQYIYYHVEADDGFLAIAEKLMKKAKVKPSASWEQQKWIIAQAIADWNEMDLHRTVLQIGDRLVVDLKCLKKE